MAKGAGISMTFISSLLLTGNAVNKVEIKSVFRDVASFIEMQLGCSQ